MAKQEMIIGDQAGDEHCAKCMIAQPSIINRAANHMLHTLSFQMQFAVLTSLCQAVTASITLHSGISATEHPSKQLKEVLH